MPRAAELILNDERLTEDLEDAEADALLRWALTVAERVVEGRIDRGEKLDDAAIAEAIRPVRRLTRAVNDLVAAHTGMSQYDFLIRLLALIDGACLLSSGSAATATTVAGSPSTPAPPG